MGSAVQPNLEAYVRLFTTQCFSAQEDGADLLIHWIGQSETNAAQAVQYPDLMDCALRHLTSTDGERSSFAALIFHALIERGQGRAVLDYTTFAHDLYRLLNSDNGQARKIGSCLFSVLQRKGHGDRLKQVVQDLSAKIAAAYEAFLTGGIKRFQGRWDLVKFLSDPASAALVTADKDRCEQALDRATTSFLTETRNEIDLSGSLVLLCSFIQAGKAAELAQPQLIRRDLELYSLNYYRGSELNVTLNATLVRNGQGAVVIHEVRRRTIDLIKEAIRTSHLSSRAVTGHFDEAAAEVFATGFTDGLIGRTPEGDLSILPAVFRLWKNFADDREPLARTYAASRAYWRTPQHRHGECGRFLELLSQFREMAGVQRTEAAGSIPTDRPSISKQWGTSRDLDMAGLY